MSLKGVDVSMSERSADTVSRTGNKIKAVLVCAEAAGGQTCTDLLFLEAPIGRLSSFEVTDVNYTAV